MIDKTEGPLLTVILPIYNVENYLDKCIESVVSQSYKNIEIILVDDGSTDHCGEICDGWTKKDSRITVLHKHNGGLVRARQAGLRIASGDYIAFVDSDDWIEREMYESLIEIAISHNPDLVTSGLIRDYANHSVVENEKIEAGVYEGEKLHELLHHVIHTSHFFESKINMHITNKIFRREILEKYQMAVPADAKVGEDADVVYPYLFESKKIAVSGRNFYHYVMRDDSIMGASAAHKKSLEIMQEIFSRCISKNEERIQNIREQLSQVAAFFTCMSAPESIVRLENGILFPFQDVKRHDKVILYGAGRFGKAVKELFMSKQYCEILAWSDKAETDGVIPPEKIPEYQFDRLILAVINAAVADEIEDMLVEIGIDRQKICRVIPNWNMRKQE